MPVEITILTWEQLLEFAQNHTSAQRVHRPGHLPLTVPIPSSVNKLSLGTPLVVVLYRDVNSWCPFCERVWFALEEKQVPFLTEFIDSLNKPAWYFDRVPTGIVPAARIRSEFVHGSKDILLALEAQFTDSPLLPIEPHENAKAKQYLEDSKLNEAQTGYKFLLAQASTQELDALESAFEAELDRLEQALAEYPGAYFFSTFSLVDITYAPQLERLAASLPLYRNYHIKGNPRFPRINAWLAALNERPAYQRVKTDAATFNLWIQRFHKLKPIADPIPLDPVLSEAMHYRAEAAEQLNYIREVLIADILESSAIQALSLKYDASVEVSIELYLKLLAASLLYGDEVLSSWSKMRYQRKFDPCSDAVGAITLAYIGSQICAPRDMSAGAATAFRAAVEKVLLSIPSYHWRYQ